MPCLVVQTQNIMPGMNSSPSRFRPSISTQDMHGISLVLVTQDMYTRHVVCLVLLLVHVMYVVSLGLLIKDFYSNKRRIHECVTVSVTVSVAVSIAWSEIAKGKEQETTALKLAVAVWECRVSLELADALAQTQNSMPAMER